jgi:hypothetical protein
MQTPSLLVSTVVALPLLAVPAVAQQKQPSSEDLAAFGLPVYSSEGQRIGRVTQVRTADGQVFALRAELSSAAGLGGRVVDIPASRFTRGTGRVQLSLTTVEVIRLPHIKP